MSAFAKTDIVAFDDLCLKDLYALLRLRSEVFVVEQNCVYLDLDGLDQAALHVLVKDRRGLIAYTRLLPPGVAHPDVCSIGRVITSSAARGEGLGKAVMSTSIAACKARWPASEIVIHAQTYLRKFYGALGFQAEGAEFLEDGLPHVKMRLSHP